MGRYHCVINLKATMQVKKYIAQDMQEAVRLIKEEMGPKAVILSTRKIRKGSGAFGLFGKYVLEVTAARDDKPTHLTKPKATKVALKPQDRAAMSPPSGNKPNAMSDYEWEISQNAPKEPRQIEKEKSSSYQGLQDEIIELKDLIQDLRQGARREANNQGNVTHLRYELNELKHMVSDLVNQTAGVQDLNLHGNLLSLYQQLSFNGVEEKFAKKLCEEVQKKVPQSEINNFSYVKIYLARMFMQVLHLLPNPAQVSTKGPRILALLGATGVGKTTTLAKIAAAEKLKNPELKVGLITIDTYRIAAVQQLQEYAKILKIPCKVVHDKTELDEVIKSFAKLDLILIDTAGRSQRDALQMEELKNYLEGRENFTNLLVLSTTTKDADMAEMTKRFSIVPLHGVIFTKLDESTNYGSIFNHSIRFKLPLAWLTTGQNVPEDMEEASRERLADLLLNISGELEGSK